MREKLFLILDLREKKLTFGKVGEAKWTFPLFFLGKGPNHLASWIMGHTVTQSGESPTRRKL
jgi:hypothetical protein